MDVNTGAFSPDGSLFQLEYACAAADRGSLAIGVEAEGAVVLVCARGGGIGINSSPSHLNPDALVKLRSDNCAANRKLMAISPTIGCAAGGFLPDSRVLIASARNTVTNHWFTFSEPPSVAAVAAEVGVVALSFSNHPRLRGDDREKAPLRMSRPFGAALLLAAVEVEDSDDAEIINDAHFRENDNSSEPPSGLKRTTGDLMSSRRDDGPSQSNADVGERPRRPRHRSLPQGKLYHLPPTGAPRRWRAKAIGQDWALAERDVAAYLRACESRDHPEQDPAPRSSTRLSKPPSLKDAGRAAVRALLLRTLDENLEDGDGSEEGQKEEEEEREGHSGSYHDDKPDGDERVPSHTQLAGAATPVVDEREQRRTTIETQVARYLDRIEVAVVQAEGEGDDVGGFRVLSTEEARALLL